MTLSEKQARRSVSVLVVSLIMLVGGIIEAIYCTHEIKELLNWAKRIETPG
jgi:hypothetical protein